MKRTERHHLKENELVSLAVRAREAVERSGPRAVTVLVAAVAAIAVMLGYLGWQARLQGRAGALLAEAMSIETAYVGPPAAPGAPQPALRFDTERQRYEAALEKFTSVADQFPATDAGVFARYRQASLQMLMGNADAAVAAYQDVLAQSGNGIYSQMARLGLADAQVRTGQLDQAITTYKSLADQTDGPLPVDGILMQLGRAYQQAGQLSDAEQTFERLVNEFPTSPFNGEAQRALDDLKKT